MSVEKTTNTEKIIRILMIAGIAYGGILAYNAIAPNINKFLDNMWYLLGVGVPLAGIITFALINPMFLWMGFKNISRKITGFFIKLDPLSFMERYVDILKEKKENLDKIKTNLQAKKVALERRIEQTKDELEENTRLGKGAININNKEQASYYGELLVGNKESLELYKPIYDKMSYNLSFLDKVSENWEYSIRKLESTIQRKRTEYEALRDAAKALNQATEFINGNTEEGRIYKESIVALEANVSEKIAFINEFEKNSKNIMEAIDIEKAANRTDGLDALQSALGDNLLLPSDWITKPQIIEKQIQYSHLLK